MLLLCWISLFAVLASLSLILVHLKKLHGTTMVAPAIWLMTCLLFTLVLTLGFTMTSSETPHQRLLIFLAANSTFCPQMGLFGAKRPQDRGWQVIVATLWIVLSIPVLQSLAFSSDGFFEVHGMWKVFLWILILFGFLNHFLTRFAGTAFFMLIGQVAIFAPFLLRAEASPEFWLVSFQVASLFGLISTKVSATKKQRSDIDPLDRVWHDFRNMFGTVWSLRIMERVNNLAKQEDWPVQLTWNGFAPVRKLDDCRLRPDVEKCLKTLLRRFVDPDWLDARLAPKGESSNAPTQ